MLCKSNCSWENSVTTSDTATPCPNTSTLRSERRADEEEEEEREKGGRRTMNVILTIEHSAWSGSGGSFAACCESCSHRAPIRLHQRVHARRSTAQHNANMQQDPRQGKARHQLPRTAQRQHAACRTSRQDINYHTPPYGDTGIKRRNTKKHNARPTAGASLTKMHPRHAHARAHGRSRCTAGRPCRGKTQDPKRQRGVSVEQFLKFGLSA
jgi:hypothetical protein